MVLWKTFNTRHIAKRPMGSVTTQHVAWPNKSENPIPEAVTS